MKERSKFLMPGASLDFFAITERQDAARKPDTRKRPSITRF
jgi:hypothetical protein